MVKIRICGDTENEVDTVIELFENLFPEMRWSTPRQGSNPKYAEDQKWFSYGEPRIKDKKPVKVNFRKTLSQLAGKAAALEKKSTTTKKRKA